MQLDRPARDRLTAIIDQYLDEVISAFEFDDAIFDLTDESEDETVKNVVNLLWYHYDDCFDHKVNLSKEQWDYFQRLLLILRSDSHLGMTKSRTWSYTQLVAVSALGLFVAIAPWFGFGEQLFAVALPFGLVSIAISEWRLWTSGPFTPSEIALTPFFSFGQLRQVRRHVSSFHKKRWPERLKTSVVNQIASNTVRLLGVYLPWLIVSPLVLLAQTFPKSDSQPQITIG